MTSEELTCDVVEKILHDLEEMIEILQKVKKKFQMFSLRLSVYSTHFSHLVTSSGLYIGIKTLALGSRSAKNKRMISKLPSGNTAKGSSESWKL